MAEFKRFIKTIDPSKRWKLKKIVDTDCDIPKIAKYITEWETKLADLMGFTFTDTSDIKKVGKNYPMEPIIERKQVLFVWKGKAKADATYKNLLKICLAGGDIYTAEKICELIQDTKVDADPQRDTATPNVSPSSSDVDSSNQSASASNTPPVKRKKHSASTRQQRGIHKKSKRRQHAVSSASNTPPAKRKKPSASTRQHRETLKHNKHKKSKKRRVVTSSSSSSSTSSSATSSDSSDSDHVATTKRRKRKHHKKKLALMQYVNNYLKPRYQHESIACDDKLSIAPCSEFISLHLVEKDGTIHEDDTFSQVSQHDEIPLELEGIVSQGKRCVLIEGPSGIGKSTLAWELCRKLKDKMVVLLKLHKSKIQKATSLEDLIYHEDEQFRRKVVSEVRKCEGENVLFILDGFDKMPSVVQNEDCLIMQLISGSCLRKATCLVTSQPSVFKSDFPQGFKHIEVRGFTDECRRKYIEKAFGSKHNAHFKQFMLSNPIINSLMCIPINCAIIAQRYQDRKLMPRTMTQLYTTLILALIKRHMISSGKWDKHFRVPSSLKELLKEKFNISIDLKRVSKLAYNGLFKKDVFTDSDVGEGFQHLGLMNAVKEMYVCEGATTSYSFLHRSIQQYLAAWYVSCRFDLVDKGFSKIVSQSRPIPHLGVFGQFLCGIVGYNKEFFQKVSILGSSYLLHCLYEIQDISKLSKDMKASILHLFTPLDMYVFGYCLVHVPIQCQSVHIYTSLEMLVYSLSTHTNGGTLGTIKGLYINVQESVHIISFKLTSLTKYFHINSLTLNQIFSPLVRDLAEWISKNSPGLTSIGLEFSESCENDYLLFQSIQCITNLKEFSLECYTPTQKGLQELSKIITTSSLTNLVLEYHPALLCHETTKSSDIIASSRLLWEALSSSTISALATNFGYRVCTNAGKIEHVTLLLNSIIIHPLEVLRSFQYLSCIAKMSSIKSITVQIEHNINDVLFAMPHFCCNFIMSLNNSLNHSMENLYFDGLSPKTNPSFRDCMARALRRDSAVPRHNLRRSQSLCDLRTLHFPHRHQLLQQEHDSPRPLSSLRCHSRPSYGWRHIPLRSRPRTGICSPTFTEPTLYQSCPNLLEMQALRNMHPFLQEALRLYNKIRNSTKRN